jgi:hypothetical protein
MLLDSIIVKKRGGEWQERENNIAWCVRIKFSVVMATDKHILTHVV